MQVPNRFSATDDGALAAALESAEESVLADGPSSADLHRLAVLIREAEAASLDGQSVGRLAHHRLVLARAAASSGDVVLASKNYVAVVRHLRQSPVELHELDLAFLSGNRLWRTLLAALSRTPRTASADAEQVIRFLWLMRRLGRDPRTAFSGRTAAELPRDARVACALLGALEALVEGELHDITKVGFREGDDDWAQAVDDLIVAAVSDERAALTASIARVATAARGSSVAVNDVSFHLCAWLALCADPLADDLQLFQALAGFAFSSGTQEHLGEVAHAYGVPTVSGPPVDTTNWSAAVTDDAELLRLHRARSQLLRGERRKSVASLRPTDGSLLSRTLSQVLLAHAVAGDPQPRPSSGLDAALDQAVQSYGPRSSLSASVRESLILTHLRAGQVARATSELDAWSLARAPRRLSRLVLEQLVEAFRAPMSVGSSSKVAPSGLGWRSQLVGAESGADDSQDCAERLGAAHPAVVARRVLYLHHGVLPELGARAYAEAVGDHADWLLAQRYNDFHHVFSLRVSQGECLLRVGHSAHAARVLTYAATRLDQHVPDALALRARARLMLGQALVADRQYAQAQTALLVLEPTCPDEEAAASYLGAVACQGLGDLTTARILLELCEMKLSPQGHLGVTPSAVRRRRETLAVTGTGQQEGQNQ